MKTRRDGTCQMEQGDVVHWTVTPGGTQLWQLLHGGTGKIKLRGVSEPATKPNTAGVMRAVKEPRP